MSGLNRWDDTLESWLMGRLGDRVSVGKTNQFVSKGVLTYVGRDFLLLDDEQAIPLLAIVQVSAEVES